VTATSVSISAQTLIELKVLRSRVGVALLGAAVLDDVLVIVVLSLFIAIVSGDGGIVDVLLTVARMVLFLGATLLIGRRIVPPVMASVSRWPISQPVLSVAIVLTLLLAWSAEYVGGNPDTGAWNGVTSPVTGIVGGSFTQILPQVLEVLAIGIFAFGTSYAFFTVLKRAGLLRSRAEDEVNGLDMPEMGEHGYVTDGVAVPGGMSEEPVPVTSGVTAPAS
jgi:hypothetical protein